MRCDETISVGRIMNLYSMYGTSIRDSISRTTSLYSSAHRSRKGIVPELRFRIHDTELTISQIIFSCPSLAHCSTPAAVTLTLSFRVTSEKAKQQTAFFHLTSSILNRIHLALRGPEHSRPLSGGSHLKINLQNSSSRYSTSHAYSTSLDSLSPSTLSQCPTSMANLIECNVYTKSAPIDMFA